MFLWAASRKCGIVSIIASENGCEGQRPVAKAMAPVRRVPIRSEVCSRSGEATGDRSYRPLYASVFSEVKSRLRNFLRIKGPRSA